MNQHIEFMPGERCIGHGIASGLNIDGYHCTIIKRDGDYNNYLVEFDEKFHSDLHGDNLNRWWVSDRNLIKDQSDTDEYIYKLNDDMFINLIG